jgi:hypothetical protein
MRLFAWMRRLPQLAFWPFNRRREEALRLRLLREKIMSRRTWRGNLERQVTALEKRMLILVFNLPMAPEMRTALLDGLHTTEADPLTEMLSTITAKRSAAGPASTAAMIPPSSPLDPLDTANGPAAPS